MINFTLPNSFYLKQANDFIVAMSRYHAEALKHKQFNICAESGSVPYLSWNGGINSNVGAGIYYNSLVDFQRAIIVPNRLNMANVLLEDYDYDDCFGQTILEIFHDGSTLLEISSIPLMEKINCNYPNYRFVFSKQADLINEFTPEILNGICQIPNVVRIGIPDKYSYDIEWLKQLQSKSKYEITVNPMCPPSCEHCDSCVLQEHQNQINFSNVQLIANCNKRNDIYNPNKIISIDEIVKTYNKMGFSYFTFNFNHAMDENFWVSFYIDYFFKPEYHSMLFTEWSKSKAEGGVRL